MIKNTDYVYSAINRCGLKREVFDDSKLPSDINRISIIVCLGEPRSLFSISSLIMNDFPWKVPDSYVVVVSYPGYSHLFPFASEFWSIPETVWSRVWENRNNQDDVYQVDLLRNLRNHFVNTYSFPLDTKLYWNQGLTALFRNSNPTLSVRLPATKMVSGEVFKKISQNINKKVFCWAATSARNYDGSEIHSVDFDFWKSLAEKFIDNGYTPVFWNSRVGCYDTTNIKDAVTVNTILLSEAVGVCRLCDCVVDLCNTGSFIASLSRVNLVSSVFRSCFYSQKDYEVDDLINGICKNWKRNYYFMLPYGFNNENSNLTIDGILKSVNDLVNKNEDRENSGEIFNKISYSCVRHCNKKPLTPKYVKINCVP